MKYSGAVVLWLRLTFSLLCAVVNGIDLSFNVYAVTLKKTFNFTQTQVEIVASLGCVGYGLTFLQTLLTSTFGYAVTFVVTWIALPLSGGLFYVASVHKDFFHFWPSLVYLIQLLLSTSNGMSLMAVNDVCVQMLDKKYTGTFIGVFGTAICFGKIVFAAMFDKFCNSDLAKFFLSYAVMSGVLLGICFLLLYPAALAIEDNVSQSSEGQDREMTSREMFNSKFFHVTFWSSAIFASVGYTILNNITSIADSLGIEDSFSIVSVMSVCIMVLRLMYGGIFDAMSSISFGFMLLFSMYVSCGLGLLLGLYLLNTSTIYILTVLCGVGVSAAFTLPVAILVVHFGRSNFSTISVCFYVVLAVSELLLQVCVGYLYDSKSTDGNVCLGETCFYWSFVAMLSISVIVLIVQVANFFLKLWNKNSPN